MSPNELTLPAPGRNLRLLFGNYGLHALIIALIFLLPAHGLNLLVGYTGLLSLAQAAFFWHRRLYVRPDGRPFWHSLLSELPRGGGACWRHRAATWHSGAQAARHLFCDVYTWLRHHRAGDSQKLDQPHPR